MHSDPCKKIIPTAHKNDEMIQLQRVCTPSSCLPMIAYLTSALKNVKELEDFFFILLLFGQTGYFQDIFVL